MLDGIGTVFAAAAIAVILVAVGTTMALQVRPRLMLAGIAGAWIGLAIAAAA